MIRGFQEVSKEFKKHEEVAKLPTRGSKYSAGYDFYSPERIVVPPFGKSNIISTDVKAYMREGEVLILHNTKLCWYQARLNIIKLYRCD